MPACMKYSYYSFADFLIRSPETTEIIARQIDRKIPHNSCKGLDILVEDEVAKSILEVAISKDIRSLIQIIPIGCASAVMRHLAIRYKDARYARNNVTEVCAFLDGDMLSQQRSRIKQFMNALENHYECKAAQDWLHERLLFLPGCESPEAWIVTPRNRQPFYERFKRELNLSSGEVDNLLDTASSASKHQEFRKAAAMLGLDRSIVTSYLIESAFESAPEESTKISDIIQGFVK